MRISGSNAGHTMFRGSVKSTGYPLYSPVSPSLRLPCDIVYRHISTGVYDSSRILRQSQLAVRMGKTKTLEPERAAADRPAACVIAQQYSSATSVSSRYYRGGKNRRAFQKRYKLDVSCPFKPAKSEIQ